MATVSQPGSRAGLITALVIFVILFLVCGVLFIMKNSELNATQKTYDDLKTKYRDVISDADLSAPDADAEKLRSGPGPYSGQPVYNVLKSQRDELARLMTGQTGATAQQAQALFAAVTDQANKQLKSTGTAIPQSSVTAAITALIGQIAAAENQKADLKKEYDSALADLNKCRDDAAAQLAQYKKDIADANTKIAAAGSDTENYRKTKDEKVAELEKSLQQLVESSRKTAEDLNQQLAGKDQELGKLRKDLDSWIHKYTALRPKDIASAMIRQPDGQISRVDKNNVVYVDLGYGNQVTPGMTFQIYDRGEGIPRTGTAEDDLPAGKGTLEIVRVGPQYSECRVLKTSAGETIQEGDLIANAVYDRNTKFRFYVYGDFDVDRDKHATPAETEMVKRLIVQFGGVLTDKIDVDTDFVVMGIEPVVPNYSKQEVDEDQAKKFEQQQKEEQLKKYEDVRDKAGNLFIPILNQNRFLYMVGYYDQAMRQVP